MEERTMNRIWRWLGTRCAARRLSAGSRQREQLLRRVGWASVVAAGHRLPSAAWKAHGEAAYRRFKVDPDQVSAGARVLCRQLLMLEARLSSLARQLGAAPHRAPGSNRPAPPSARALTVGGTA